MYSYLEIGSYLGGSLQPFLLDRRCVVAYSIDPRPTLVPDIRAPNITYERNTTAEMRRLLQAAHGPEVTKKLRTFDMDAADVPRREIGIPPHPCYIDGEHTDQAVLRDFQSCLDRAARPCVIAFDDAEMMFGGIAKCLELLDDQHIEHRQYMLPAKTAVIEFGEVGLWRDQRLLDLIVSIDAHLYAMRTLAVWRQHALEYERWKGIVRSIPLARHVARAARLALHR